MNPSQFELLQQLLGAMPKAQADASLMAKAPEVKEPTPDQAAAITSGGPVPEMGMGVGSAPKGLGLGSLQAPQIANLAKSSHTTQGTTSLKNASSRDTTSTRAGDAYTNELLSAIEAFKAQQSPEAKAKKTAERDSILSSAKVKDLKGESGYLFDRARSNMAQWATKGRVKFDVPEYQPQAVKMAEAQFKQADGADDADLKHYIGLLGQMKNLEMIKDKSGSSQSDNSSNTQTDTTGQNQAIQQPDRQAGINDRHGDKELEGLFKKLPKDAENRLGIVGKVHELVSKARGLPGGGKVGGKLWDLVTPEDGREMRQLAQNLYNPETHEFAGSAQSASEAGRIEKALGAMQSGVYDEEALRGFELIQNKLQDGVATAFATSPDGAVQRYLNNRPNMVLKGDKYGKYQNKDLAPTQPASANGPVGKSGLTAEQRLKRMEELKAQLGHK